MEKINPFLYNGTILEKMIQSVFQQIQKLLDDEKIEYVLTQHEAVKTSEEAAKIRGVDPKTGAKAMVVKANEEFFLFVLPGDRKIDWKKIKNLLRVKRLRLATEDEAEEITSVKIGSIPPFGNILNLPTYFDKGILENEWINFNPGSKIHSISMKSADLLRLVKAHIEEFGEAI